MKNTISIIALLASTVVFGQVFVNGTSTTSPKVTSPGVLLEFQTGINKGIILPWNVGEVAPKVNGTFILDTTTNQVKAYSNGNWINLSNNAKTTNTIDMTLQSAPYTELPKAKAVITEPTATTTAPDGILVLESATKALVLPKVANPHLNIGNPAPGMIVFDPVKELLCVYNGTEWSYWSATPR